MCADIEAEFTAVFELIGFSHYYIQTLVVNFPAVFNSDFGTLYNDSSGNHTILNRG